MLDVPLFVSHRTLGGRRSLPEAAAPWALDSGGFSELSMYGEWRTTEAEYAAAVNRYADEIGQLAWAAPMDWMCGPSILARTGLGIGVHQQRTVENFLRLREAGLPVIPVLQGWELDDYLYCVEMYEREGVELASEPVVGVGSVVGREAGGVGAIFRALWGLGIKCHGFGVKRTGLRLYGAYLESADSMAWSYDARRARPLSGCTHKSCANCPRYAMRWREHVLSDLGWQPLFMETA